MRFQPIKYGLVATLTSIALVGCGPNKVDPPDASTSDDDLLAAATLCQTSSTCQSSFQEATASGKVSGKNPDGGVPVAAALKLSTAYTYDLLTHGDTKVYVDQGVLDSMQKQGKLSASCTAVAVVSDGGTPAAPCYLKTEPLNKAKWYLAQCNRSWTWNNATGYVIMDALDSAGDFYFTTLSSNSSPTLTVRLFGQNVRLDNTTANKCQDACRKEITPYNTTTCTAL